MSVNMITPAVASTVRFGLLLADFAGQENGFA
jgi:hypothetical protein